MDSESRIRLLQGYIQEDFSDAEAKYMLALEYIKLENDIEALKWMEELWKNHGNYLPNYYHLGKLLERMGDTKRAFEVYEKGCDLAKSCGDLHSFSELKTALDILD